MIEWSDVPEIWALLSVYEERWKYTYPDLNIQAETLRMGEWLEANPGKRPKKCWKRFMVRWLARNQAAIERAEAREMIQRMQQRADASVGKWEGYK